MRNVVIMLGALVTGWMGAEARTFELGPDDDLQAVVDELKPGDEVVLAEGDYREPVVVRCRGTEESPIRIRGGGKARFSGLVRLRPEWEPWRDGMFRAPVVQPVHQLFVDGALMTPARWPNMTFAERWENGKWPAADKGAVYGTMVDADLAQAGVDFTGCMAVLNIGSWQTFRRRITGHGVGRDRFTYPVDPESRLGRARHPVGMDRYCIYGKAALDAPGEWFHDAEASMLYLCPPSGKVPGDLLVESKELAEAIVLDGARHVEVSGIHLRGTTVRMEHADHCTLEDVHIVFGSTVANPFGENPPLRGDGFSARKWFGESSVDALTEVRGDDNVIRDVTVRFSEGPALTVRGARNLVENCLFRDIDWHGLDYGFGIDLLAAVPVTVRRVTLDHCGGSEGLRLPNHGKSLVEYCHLHHCGLRQSDGAIIQAATAGVAGTTIRYNWVHDHDAFHWGGIGIRGDDGTRGLLVHHNVVWNCREKGIVTKGDENRVYHNTCFDNPVIDILVPRNRLPGKVKELAEQNRHSEVANNLGRVTGSWRWERKKLPPYAPTSHNLDAGTGILRDPVGWDFRLRAGAEAIDAGRVIEGISVGFRGAAPDLGAYESGAPRWTAGYQGEKQ